MTSLSEVYEPDAEFQTSLRRLYAGVGLFLLGVVLVVAGIGAATETFLVGQHTTLAEARELGGILGGVGVPAIFIGIFAVLPAGRRTRAAAVAGALVALVGVVWFVQAYPCGWSGETCAGNYPNRTLPVTFTYFLGTVTTFWCLFVGVANFKSRNNPGGTAHVEVTAQGETRVIEVPKSELSKFSGSLGVLGGPPEPDAETQTNRTSSGSGAASDGGDATEQIREVVDDDAVVERRSGTNGHSTPTSGVGADTDPNDDGGVDVFRAGSSAASDSTTGSSSGPASGRSATGSRADADRSGRSATTDDDWTPTGSRGTEPRQSAGADRDRYCGSCQHFRYVRTEHGMQPYCGAHDEIMDDMDACDQYEGRST